MSIIETKKHLTKLLNDKDNKVIALSGKWGTGKSFLWHQVKQDSNDDTTKNSLYVSLFGLTDLNQIKFKILQNALPNSKIKSSAWQTLANTLSAGQKALRGLHRSFSALDELALLAAPTLFKNKTIVLDDIERKHDKLSIDEILGFIDEFTQQHGSRFVLVLNSDKLANRAIWDTLREKVIDQEIRLETSPVEACEIALTKTPSLYASSISKAVEVCNITNIRIINKIIKAINLIMGTRKNVPTTILNRVIPSAVLLAAIHYRGIDNGPDFKFVLSYDTSSKWFRSKTTEPDKTSELEEEWSSLIENLGIRGIDGYDLLVVDFLESGLLNDQKISEIINKFVSEADEFAARAKLNNFIDRVRWDHKSSESQLIEEARQLTQTAHLLDVHRVTYPASLIEEMHDGKEISDEIIGAWIEHFKLQNLDDFEFDNHFAQPIHNDIKSALSNIEAQTASKVTIFEACMHIIKHKGWNTAQETALSQATVNDFEVLIPNLEPYDLRDFMRQMTKMCADRNTYVPHFGSATDNFLTACNNIIANPESERLGKLVDFLTHRVRTESVLSTNE